MYICKFVYVYICINVWYMYESVFIIHRTFSKTCASKDILIHQYGFVPVVTGQSPRQIHVVYIIAGTNGCSFAYSYEEKQSHVHANLTARE